MKPNINYEDDTKHEVSRKALKTLEKVMLSQDDYGFEKYKKPLHHNMEYDWLQMFLEEMADGLKYIQNEIDRKDRVKQVLELALEHKEFALVKMALKILSKEGTGK